jgi:nucleoside-diphosphate-sugar epimerase
MTTVLLTGATGFVGGATAALLLADARVERLVVLVRAGSEAAARERVAHSLARFGGSMPGRVEVLKGDLEHVTLPQALRRSLTHVIHAAAHTSFRSVQEVRRSNVLGTLALAEQLRGAPRLERFLHVSTAYRCGLVRERVVHDDLPSAAEHVVEYTRTKAEAETALAALADLPWLVARPSIVVGHTQLGVVPSSTLFWYYHALAQADVAPFAPAQRRDIVPVDYVAAALIHLAFVGSLPHRHLHVSAGERACTWLELRAALGREGAGETVAAEVLARHPAWARFGAGAESRLRDALAACAPFSRVPVDSFDNQRLLASGFAPPPRATDYFGRCLESARGKTWLELLDDDEA